MHSALASSPGTTTGTLPALEQPYLDLLKLTRSQGAVKGDRTGTGTLSTFGAQLRFDLQRGFPLITTKKVFWKAIAYELLWFLRGDSNARWLQERGVTIWDEWAKPDGDLGPVYGVQWRSWPTPDGGHIDQIAEVVKQLKNNPDSRRIIVSAWNVSELSKMALMPCHAFFQFYVADPVSARDRARAKEEGLADTLPKPRLSCQLYQRSADLFLGVPFNIASYALLTHMLAQQCDLDVGDFIWTGGDCHIYNNHFEQVDLQLTRTPIDPPPKLVIKRKPASIFDYEYEDFEIAGYQSHAAIKAPVAV
jgi:thymidylate synthase